MALCPVCKRKIGILEKKVKLPDGNIAHKRCHELEQTKKYEEERVKESLWPNKLKDIYNRASESFENGKDNQAKFYNQKLLNEKINNEDLIHKVKDLILEIEYDDFEDDVTSCFDSLVKLNLDNQNTWFEYISFLKDYVGDTLETINAALIQFPKSEQLLEMKCNVLIEEEENGIEVLRALKILKVINPTNTLISNFKESAIEILMENEEENNPEAIALIDEI